MRLSCPSCGATSSLDALLAHEGAREAVMIALQLPAPLGKLLVQYVGLFRPAQRQLSLDRVAVLLGELQPMIDAGRIERSGQAWAAPVDSWKAAIESILAARDRLTLPLKSHGYLLEILAGAASKAAGVAEAGRETRARGVTPTGAHASHKPFRPAPATAPDREQASAGMASVKSALKKGGTA